MATHASRNAWARTQTFFVWKRKTTDLICWLFEMWAFVCYYKQKSNFNHPSIIYAQSTKKLDPRYGFCVDVLSTATTAFDVPYAAPSSVWKPWTQAFFPSENPRLNGGFEKTSTPFKGLSFKWWIHPRLRPYRPPKPKKLYQPCVRGCQMQPSILSTWILQVIFGMDLQFLKPAFCI